MRKWFTLIVCISALVSSCSKDDFRDEGAASLPEVKELTPEEEFLRGKLNETALLVSQIAGEKDVQRELYNFVNMRYEGNYRVKFEHLLKPGELSKSALPSRFETGAFRDRFMKLGGSGGGAKGGQSGLAEMAEYLIENDIEIAWHYSQEWDKAETPAVTFNPLDNDSVNVGYRMLTSDDGELIMEEVLVDDDYAFEHPVLIIDQHESLPEDDPNAGKFLGEYAQAREVSTTGPWPDGTAKYNKIFVYQVRTYKGNFRGIFGGENKMYFKRAGKEIVLGPDNIYSVYVTIDRWAGRKEVWRTVNAVWDENWEEAEIEQWIGVEAIKVSGDFSFKIGGDISMKFEKGPSLDDPKVFVIKATPTIKLFSWELTIGYKNAPWYDMTKSREQFFHDNWTDFGRHGMKDERSIYLAGSEHRKDGFYFTWDVEAYE